MVEERGDEEEELENCDRGLEWTTPSLIHIHKRPRAESTSFRQASCATPYSSMMLEAFTNVLCSVPTIPKISLQSDRGTLDGFAAMTLTLFQGHPRKTRT